MAKVMIICDYCKFELGYCEPSKVILPLMGHHFSSPKPEWGVSAPFNDGAYGEGLKCRQCKRRAFRDVEVITDKDGEQYDLKNVKQPEEHRTYPKYRRNKKGDLVPVKTRQSE